MLDKDDALKIAKKLDAQIDASKKNRPHDLAVVYYSGQVVALFGIRRGSNKGHGHDHIPHDLHCSPHFCRELAICTKSHEQWVELMRSKGFINRS